MRQITIDPYCKKTKYISKGAALLDLERIKKKPVRNKIPINVYLCRCGSWHLTSKPNWEEKIKELEDTIVEKDKIIDLLKEEGQTKIKQDELVVEYKKQISTLHKQIATLHKKIKQYKNDYYTILGKLNSLNP